MFFFDEMSDVNSVLYIYYRRVDALVYYKFFRNFKHFFLEEKLEYLKRALSSRQGGFVFLKSALRVFRGRKKAENFIFFSLS